jgi:hypothetical protein
LKTVHHLYTQKYTFQIWYYCCYYNLNVKTSISGSYWESFPPYFINRMPNHAFGKWYYTIPEPNLLFGTDSTIIGSIWMWILVSMDHVSIILGTYNKYQYISFWGDSTVNITKRLGILVLVDNAKMMLVSYVKICGPVKILTTWWMLLDLTR